MWSISAPWSMAPEARAALLRLIADAIYRHAKGDPDKLARRILEDIEAAEYDISKRPSIEGKLIGGRRLRNPMLASRAAAEQLVPPSNRRRYAERWPLWRG
jgi:hypothetical protein